MTFATLTSDAIFIREGNSDYLGIADYDDTALINLMITSAKRELKNDLMDVWRLREDVAADMTELDSIVDLNQYRLQVALAYKQLYKYYFENHSGIDSKTYLRMREYGKLYNEERANFTNLKKNNVINTTSTAYLNRW
jgi:hypothetical protein